MVITIIEVTATLIGAYLILRYASGFATAVAAAGKAYVDAVVALQGGRN